MPSVFKLALRLVLKTRTNYTTAKSLKTTDIYEYIFSVKNLMYDFFSYISLNRVNPDRKGKKEILVLQVCENKAL
jgi:hypothetical protein